MADNGTVTIGDLPGAGPLLGSELVAAWQAGATVALPAADFATAQAAAAAQLAADAAQGAANDATTTANNALSVANSAPKQVYATVAAGIAATTANQVFGVDSGDGPVLNYKNNGDGTATATGTQSPTTAQVTAAISAANAAGQRITTTAGTPLLTVGDALGFVGFQISSLGEISSPNGVSISKGVIDTLDLKLQAVSGTALFRAVDSLGFYADVPIPSTNKDDSFSSRNTDNLLWSYRYQNRVNTLAPLPIWKYNHIFVYGQSLGQGYEGWPALSKSPRFGNVMLGQAPRPNDATLPQFVGVSDSNFDPLIGVTQTPDDPSVVLTDSQVSALAAGNGAMGEAPIIGAINQWKTLHNDWRGFDNDQSALVVGGAYGVGGMAIEQLTKGATDSKWPRLSGAVSTAQANAASLSATYGIPCWLWMQGENNYDPGAGSYDTSKAGYKAKLGVLRSDVDTDFASTQTKKPAMFMYQTGGSSSRDDNQLSIGMAQLEYAVQTPNTYMVGPTYQYPDKGVHLDPNSYRWFGEMVGKVMHYVMDRRQNWLPLYPRRSDFVGNTIHIDFHVPVAPLVFDNPYSGYAAASIPNQGFRVTDAAGADNPIVSLRIVLDTIVEVVCARPLTADSLVWYASQATNGHGGLRDSDPFLAVDNYEYTAGSGQYAASNIATLVGRPYPLYNWSVAFCITASYAL